MRQAVQAGIAFEAGDALREFYGEEADAMLSGLKEAQSAARMPSGPKPGERRMVQGKLAEWDGRGWVEVK
jgi:hypothetical protein